MLTELASREKVIGVKQSARAIRDGRAQRVFLACDADELVLEPIRIACGSLPVEEGYTMVRTYIVGTDGEGYTVETLEDAYGPGSIGFSAEVLNTESVSDLICFLLCRYLDMNLRFRTCKFCGKLFGVTGNYKSEYCSRVISGSEKTCKEMGSVRLYEKKIFSEPAIKEYKRSYKAHNARIRYGLMTREEFDKWSAEAREKRDACVAGKLPLEDFVAWLDSDKQR